MTTGSLAFTASCNASSDVAILGRRGLESLRSLLTGRVSRSSVVVDRMSWQVEASPPSPFSNSARASWLYLSDPVQYCSRIDLAVVSVSRSVAMRAAVASEGSDGGGALAVVGRVELERKVGGE
jgi:hypothetical protein